MISYGIINYDNTATYRNISMRGDFVRFRSVIILFLVCIIALCISGCESANSFKMTVISSYGGYGIDGQDLGSGEFTEELSVSDGDRLYELTNGHWSLKPRSDFEVVIISIVDSDDNGVTIKIDDKTTYLNYNKKMNVKSRYAVDDGINYNYSIYFTKE